MTGYTGRLLLVEVGTGSGSVGSETWTTIAGSTDNTFSINNQTVDTTTKSDSGIRQLLDAKVLQSVSCSGNFILRDEVAHKTLQTVATAGLLRNFRVTIPGDSTAGGTYAGAFMLTSLEFSGAHDGATQASFTLESGGTVTYTAAT